MIVPADKPCMIGFVNYEKQNLTLTFTNQSVVSAYLFTLAYPNRTRLVPLRPQFPNQNIQINVTSDNDMAYLYLGSINQNSAQTMVSW